MSASIRYKHSFLFNTILLETGWNILTALADFTCLEYWQHFFIAGGEEKQQHVSKGRHMKMELQDKATVAFIGEKRATLICLHMPGMLVFPESCRCSVFPLGRDGMFGWMNLLPHVCVGVFTLRHHACLLNEVKKRHSVTQLLTLSYRCFSKLKTHQILSYRCQRSRVLI